MVTQIVGVKWGYGYNQLKMIVFYLCYGMFPVSPLDCHGLSHQSLSFLLML